MTKREFLQELQRSLAGKFDSSRVAEHVEYYSEYIEIAVRKGEAEEAVLRRLGSPRLIAKSLTDTAELSAGGHRSFSFAGKCRKAIEKVKDWFENL